MIHWVGETAGVVDADALRIGSRVEVDGRICEVVSFTPMSVQPARIVVEDRTTHEELVLLMADPLAA